MADSWNLENRSVYVYKKKSATIFGSFPKNHSNTGRVTPKAFFPNLEYENVWNKIKKQAEAHLRVCRP